MVAARLARRFVHALLDNDPIAIVGDDEAMQVEIEPVLYRLPTPLVMPSILAEIAYISNPDEEDLIRKPAFVRDVAQSLYHGIVSFLANNRPDIR